MEPGFTHCAGEDRVEVLLNFCSMEYVTPFDCPCYDTDEPDVCVTIPTIFFWFKETKQKSLEEIDLLFGGRALGTLDDDINSKAVEFETVATARQLEDVTV